VNARLSEALDHPFAQSGSGPRRFTKAVVSGGLILHQNQRFEFAIGAGAGNVV